MAKVTLCFSKSRSLGSALIRWFSWGSYSHVDFVTQDGRLLGARMFGGVKVRSYDSLHGSPREHLSFEVPSQGEADAILKSAFDKVGQPYDWMGIIAMPFRSSWQHRSKVFCSEYVAQHCRARGVVLQARVADHRLTPRDLRMSPLLN